MRFVFLRLIGFTALAYGAPGSPSMLVVGAINAAVPTLAVRLNLITPLTTLSGYTGGTVSQVLIDPNNSLRLYVLSQGADSHRLASIG